MVESAMISLWPEDWAIQEMEGTSLPKPCVVRFKLFSLDERFIRNGLGALTKRENNGEADCLGQP